MNSKNGKNILTKKDLTPFDICKIIKQCGDSGISELKFGNLSLSFKAIKDTQVENIIKEEKLHSNVGTQEAEQTSPHLPMDESVVNELEAASKEETLANMQLEDPVGYEDILAQGDLVDLGDRNAEA